MSKAATKEKKSFSKKLFRRGSVRSVGSFMSRVLRTLSTLSHFGTEEHATEDEKDDGGFTSFKTGGSVPSDDSDCGGFLFGDKVPGVAGLKNHGNTCFMNAILQCLSNTELFAEYLALEQYRGDDSDEKPKANGVFLQRKGQQEKGEVTEHLSGLVRALWTFEYTPQHSREFKNVVSKSALQFRGNAQHDAQEFLLWLLDRVHEDLNNIVNPSSRSSIKPPLEDDDGASEGPSLPVAGSFVQELFQAQYRSSLTCPHCQKQSNTFDPFLCISLPIPLPHTRPLYVTVVYQGKCSHCMRIGVAVPLNSTVSRLREAVSLETKIPSDQIVLTEMYYDGFHRSFCDDEDDLEIIQESDSIFAFETPEIFRPENIRSQRGSLHANLNQNNLKYGTEHNRTPSYLQGAVKPVLTTNKNAGADKIILLVCNRACSGHQGKRFGHPFVLYLERTVTWDVLQKEILEKMRHLLRPGVYIQVGPFSLRVVGVVGITYLLPQEEQPLCHPSVERAYKSCGPGGPPHVKIVVEWDKETKDYLFGHTEDEYIPDAESVRLQRELHHQPQTCSLAQCLQLYTKEEQLAPDDAWRCPHCKQLQQGSIKLSLWTLPDILILHLKRFRQEGDRRMKMQNMVKFPLVGMDMAPHMVKRSQSSWSLPSHWSPWRRPYGMGRDPEDYLYDLYAVCNHHGTMHGGHYTAYCKNSIDGQWYCFDDSDVQPISEDEVCKQTAYILFYQRRATIPAWSANSSVAGSTSSSLCEHWVNRLPGSKQPSVASAASSRRTSLASLSESVEFTGERSEDDGPAAMLRGFSTRPFVRSVQRQSSSSRSSITSPLVSENGTKPSWSLSAKLQMRSNSPSRFSLDSHSSPTLERIGEAADDKVSTSCFGSYSKHERQSGGKAPLAAMEAVTSDDGSSRRSLDEPYCKAPSQAAKRSSKAEPADNNNQAAPAEKGSLGHGASSKEPKQRSSTAGAVQKAESTGAKRTSTKAVLELEKSSKKRQTTSSTHSSPASQASSSPQAKSSTKVSSSKDKNDSTKASKASSSGTPTKKEPTQGQDGVLSGAALQKQRISSATQSTASPSPTRRKTSSGAEKSSASGRSRLSERSGSRDSPRASPLADKPSSASASRTGAASRSSLPRPESRTVRSSSSSSSVTSLRSPSVSSRDVRRSSKSEEKGLSFFKSALRQKETRRSADFGKTTILSKKTPDGAARSGAETKNGASGAGEGSGKTSRQVSPDPQAGKAAVKEESSKTSTPVRRSLLSPSKPKSSTAETGTQSPANGKKPLSKTASSRKLSSSMQSSARPTHKPQ
ncbi:ubiquitin carboxyl-terminal hydrolase 31-like isoform X1 [Megalops cyprinoides]|uniref:ubiquitin carboxyl-terminal hydrolase 31-like isoform X1 n=1 Tax=Megalops cyprinoides TaxID=118141 RepID=UPI0018650A82|nr:ubiquitin carboxyl-terminal hydrolase 31-like isoform X1 [Megalops cyprinoides]